MELRRLGGDPAEAEAFSWDALLKQDRSAPAGAASPRRPGLAAFLGVFLLAGVGVLLLPRGPELRLPAADALLGPAPEIDIQLLRVHEALAGRIDEPSLRLRSRCRLWLEKRAAQR